MATDEKAGYYGSGSLEVINIIKEKLTQEQFTGFLLGNIIKYSCRMMKKDASNRKRDAEKIVYYSTWLSEEMCDDKQSNSGPVFKKKPI